MGTFNKFFTATLMLIPLFVFSQKEYFPTNSGVKAVNEPYKAIVNATIVVNSENTIENGTLIFRDGKIINVGKGIEIPENTIIIDKKDKFIYPIDKYIITGVYGSQRILNGKPRRPHYGIDFHAPEGTPVKAMMDGEVTLAENDMYFTGGTIIFDHGHGVSTLYMHMKDIDVKIGDKVKKGQIVGTLGMSGRATGPHLDIRLNWFDVKLDPMTILR